MKSKGVQGGRLPVASHADVFRGVLLPALKTPAWEARFMSVVNHRLLSGSWNNVSNQLTNSIW